LRATAQTFAYCLVGIIALPNDFKDNVFDQTNSAQAVLESFDPRPVVSVRGRAERKESKPRWTFMLLRPHRFRPCGHATD
jgi:hypothetical protein